MQPLWDVNPMLLTVLKVIVAFWALELAVAAVWFVWDRLGFRRDQARALAKLSDFDSLEASWRLPSWDPWERSR